MQTQQATAPFVRRVDTSFLYRDSRVTDVSKTFERFGWSRPDRKKQQEIKALLNAPCEEMAVS